MNTLKSVMVVGALAVVGYGVYVVLNNNPAPPTPDWLKNQTLPNNAPAEVKLGQEVGSPGQAPGAGSLNASTASPGGMPGAPAGFEAASMPGPAAGSGSSAASNAPPFGPSPANSAPGAVPGTPLGSSPGLGQQASGPLTPYGTPSPSAPPPAPAVGTGVTATAASYPGSGTSPPRYGQSPSTPPPVPGDPLSTSTATASAAPHPGGLSTTGSATGSAPSPYGGSVPGVSGATAGSAAQAALFDTTMATAKSQLDGGKLDMALLTLSELYDDSRLTDRQQDQLCDLMDQVAGTVIYSRKSWLEAPYHVGPGEHWSDVAQKFSVPVGLLAKINGLNLQTELTVGQELKVVRGPFEAVVNVPRRTLTLMVKSRYAGRFPVILGPEFNEIQGGYTVTSKTLAHTRYDGQRYIELTPDSGTGGPSPLAIVGIADPASAARGMSQGVIGVTPKNADDLYDILSQGSKVTIRNSQAMRTSQQMQNFHFYTSMSR